jgi:hypothetical protein
LAKKSEEKTGPTTQEKQRFMHTKAAGSEKFEIPRDFDKF